MCKEQEIFTDLFVLGAIVKKKNTWRISRDFLVILFSLMC